MNLTYTQIEKVSGDPNELAFWVRYDLLQEPEETVVTFTKVDGSEREMRCTLNDTLIPEDKHPKGTGGVVDELTLRVFDLDKNEWRSFKMESVIKIEKRYE